MKVWQGISGMILLVVMATTAEAADRPEFALVIKGHQFQPQILTIPANQKVVIIVDNQDATPEEFESHELNREKVIPGLTKGKILIGPLDAGEYPLERKS